MRHSLMTENLTPLMPSDQFTIMHHSQQPSSSAAAAAAVTASLGFTSELIHASIVAATQSSQSQSQNRSHSTSASTHQEPMSNNSSNSNSCGIDSNSSSNGNHTAYQQPPKKPRSTTCVSAPRMSRSSLATLEYSVHASPRRMTRDLGTVFPNKDLSNLLVVPTFQRCQYEMVAWDAEIAKEKDDRLDDIEMGNVTQGLLQRGNGPQRNLLEMSRPSDTSDVSLGLFIDHSFFHCGLQFIRWSTALHDRLEKLGYWSDMTDPASGFPSFSERGRDVYPDVEGCQLLLRYDFQNAGCCKVLLHPNWGSKIYPATFFTTSPLDILLQVVEQVEQEYRATELDTAHL
ncbi:hypothetical protein BC939DRAFT_503836 [Gamsiella multidivaricata]|uniref:uncharacterized protein n=1 Tax=Gamsiella multidivaricata TaxID=101098 RepID=UPI00222054C1|nr:uncharacterized protein BC939DRAFT_503836 [Gamsiella multidivaricata]KAI7822328.1 hypothetical protein BC939DRAFT_503836 [Gamsiella multidivaricata]